MKKTAFLIISTLLYSLANSSNIAVSDNGGYSNIIVAINRDVSEDERLVPAIMDLFKNASVFLNRATKGAFFFEEVTIAIPSSWTRKKEYVSSIKDYSINADVDVSENGISDNPNTEQFGGCGEPGKFIRLSPNYLFNMEEPNQFIGKPDKVFIKEWAKFRYGVFDENVTPSMVKSNPRLKTYYQEKGKIQPVTCTKNISSAGRFEYRNGLTCDPSTDSKCTFRIYSTDFIQETTSLMYSSVFNSVNHFCDETEHNKEAPNWHNIQCLYKSTWEVIKSNKDYKTLVNPSVAKLRPETKFYLRQTTKSRGKTVMVLDISGSMAGTPIELLHQTTSRHILKFAPQDSEIGIVVFGTSATVSLPMTKVDDSTRQKLVDSLPKSANGGGTGIGNGLLTGLEVLKASGVVEGSVILLITDGEENAAPFIMDVTETLISTGVILNVISYGEGASLKLEKVAKLSGGSTTIFKDIHNAEANTRELGYKIMQATTSQSDIKFEGQTLISENLFFNKPEELELNVPIDQELGKNTVFSFRWTYKVVPDIQLESPSGQTFNRHSNEFEGSDTYIEFKFKAAETGHWKVILRKVQNENIDVSFTLISEPTDSKLKPVHLTTWMNNYEQDFGRSLIAPKVFAKVTKSELAVIGTTVEGLLETPNDTILISMRDDGLAPDILEDDGIYSGIVTKFNGNGRYLFKANVIGDKNAKLLISKKKHSNIEKRSLYDAEDEENDVDYEEVPLNTDFVRTAEGGILVVKNWTPTLGDIVKPARVVDLSVSNTTYVYDNRIVSLSWTAAGDDIFIGNATALDVRVASDLKHLIVDFDNQFQINQSHILDGSFEPTKGGSVTSITFQIPPAFFSEPNESVDYEDQVFIGLRYQDEANNLGDLSNIVSAVFVKLDVTPPASIQDLMIMNISTLSNGWDIHLQWTAAGDDDFEGNATSLAVWIAKRERDLSKPTTELGDAFLLDGNLPVTKGGSITQCHFLVTNEWLISESNETDELVELINDEVFFGLNYYDEAKNGGNMSNIVSVVLRHATTLNSSDIDKGNKSYIFIGVVIAIVFSLGVIVAIYIYIRRKTKSYQLVFTYSSAA